MLAMGLYMGWVWGRLCRSGWLHPHCAVEAVLGKRCQPAVMACLVTPTSSVVFAVLFTARLKSVMLAYTGVWKICQGIW